MIVKSKHDKVSLEGYVIYLPNETTEIKDNKYIELLKKYANKGWYTLTDNKTDNDNKNNDKEKASMPVVNSDTNEGGNAPPPSTPYNLDTMQNSDIKRLAASLGYKPNASTAKLEVLKEFINEKLKEEAVKN
jgi:DNA-binding LacI/PurR family transcriptional regulator